MPSLNCRHCSIVTQRIPMHLPTTLTIATRESALALWQAEHVRACLLQHYPQLTVNLLGMTTQGDQILDKSLAKIGGKGLFVKELENALLDGRADIAVHSLKDVPMLLPEGFCLAAVLPREDPQDAFVSNDYAALADLPAGAKVGTSSLRREVQLRVRYPHLEIVPLRGNVQTRLAKLDQGQYAAIILAAAGLKRLGLGARIRAVLSPEVSLPAVGQGALGIECLQHRPELVALLAPLQDMETTYCTQAERAFSRALGGSCQLPLGGYATLCGDELHLRGFVASTDARQWFHGEVRGVAHCAEALGTCLANDLLAQGAQVVLTATAL